MCEHGTVCELISSGHFMKLSSPSPQHAVEAAFRNRLHWVWRDWPADTALTLIILFCEFAIDDLLYALLGSALHHNAWAQGCTKQIRIPNTAFWKSACI